MNAKAKPFGVFMSTLSLVALMLFIFSSNVRADDSSSGGILDSLSSAISCENSGDDNAGQTDGVSQSLSSDYQNLKNVYNLAKANGTANAIDFSAADTAFSKYTGNASSCVTSQKVAAYACLTCLSPNIATISSGMNALLSLGSMAISDSCSTFAKAMNIAKAGLTAYTAECTLAKSGCGAFCLKATGGLDDLAKALKSMKASCSAIAYEDSALCTDYLSEFPTALKKVQTDITTENSPNTKASIGEKKSVCTDKYVELLASAGTGIISVVNSLKQGKSCDTASSSSTTTSSDLATKCAIAANKSLQECICYNTPYASGCGNSLATAKAQTSGLTGGSPDSTTGTSANYNPDTSTSPDTSSTGTGSTASSGAGGAGAPTGGGSSLGGANIPGGATGGGSGADAKKVNTNILGGVGGGGGGGFGGGGSSGDPKLGAYLPGGAKDPNRGVAGEQAWAKEVSGQGGKSNWEKVRDRYRDNKGSLLNN
jgi:hypothetical protein